MLSIKNSILLRKKWITAENRDKTWLALQLSLSLKLTATDCDLKLPHTNVFFLIVT